jgi:hypothetical protein
VGWVGGWVLTGEVQLRGVLRAQLAKDTGWPHGRIE